MQYKCAVLTFLGSSLNGVVVFNLEVTHAARFALKTTSAFNEEPKKEKSPKDHEYSIFWWEKAKFFGKNCEILHRIWDLLDASPVGAVVKSVHKNVVEW